MSPHGYGAYTNGCRCDICKTAKAAYMRARRTAGRETASPGCAVEGIKHGRAGYEEHGCRCGICLAAKRQMWHADWQRNGEQRNARKRARRASQDAA